MRLLITGGHGYMGRNLARLFSQGGNINVSSPSKQQMDLLNPSQVKEIIDEVNPDAVIHAAIKGGTVDDVDSIQDIALNVRMFTNLMAFVPEETSVFVIGSGAEFDRSQDIDCAEETEIDSSYPIDPYGIAKNIIARQACHDYQNTHVIRLFGCFNYDEEPFRFIKSCILNIKEGKPIEIKQDRLMDFFFMDDVCEVIHSLIIRGGFPHVNLVYPEKYSLLNIASMIIKAAGHKTYPINIETPSMGRSYTGDWTKLDVMGIKLIGLEEGIVRTCKTLL